ncbi:elongation factor 4 [Candidatus Wolfebacteria bacterium CG03_land_8_20_14_0_80_40_12]|uniref:Elongation factor 4 n=1 Tax=Candidatus Wolfebacteria bacterium CG03_land_8_20_14_0_80_40_12 TaxID=1975069 RepID=A0A2M7B551_9BACT|nr:MAG: elongation factor 4 [Candidatus Wolfebacteria bacterium CG03_land_8_20_14_0_80_40_12]
MDIRNFVIIAHIDHGKSTLADRFLELTKTVDSRHMKPQYLDQLELERERGITIKMAPVRMSYTLNVKPYTLNLIDTPGHSDFSYEVSRALAAVEGAILLVDATQGIQAQTLANLELAKKAGLKIIGSVNKIDAALPEQIKNSINELASLLKVKTDEIFKISGRTGEGVSQFLAAIIKKIPSPKVCYEFNHSQALIFDSLYDDHKGVIAFVRVFNGEYKAGDETRLVAADKKFKIKEVGYFSPQLKQTEKLSAGEIGYIATGIKEPDELKIGDTIGKEILPGYQEPKPVVFVSLFPDENAPYDDLKIALQKLKLNDFSLTFSPDNNDVLGRGFKVGFLGKLHFEITAERLEKEFNIKTVSTFPSVAYKVGTETIENPDDLPTDYLEIFEPMIKIEVLAPINYLSNVLQLREIFRIENITTENFEDRILIKAKMPLNGLIADFDDKLKAVSEGMASFSYELASYQKADLEKVEILINGLPVPGLTRFVYQDELNKKPRQMLEKLKEVLPAQQFSQALQARAGNRIIARENISALKKDVTGYLYGGDRTRKMKLWKKQKKGKKKLLQMASGVRIPVKLFKELLK